MRRWLGALLVAALVTAASTSASGQDELGELNEVASVARLRVHPGWATVELERRFDNDTPTPANFVERSHHGHGAIIGMRMRADRGWLEAALTTPEQATRRYAGEGSGLGAAALLSMPDLHVHELRIGEVAPGESRSVAYTVMFPTEYRDGKHWARAKVVTAVTTLPSAEQLPALWVDDTPAAEVVASHGSIVGERVGLAAAQERPIDGALALIGLSDGRALVSCRVHVAPQLSPLPKAPHVVLLIDSSRSVAASDLSLVPAAVGAYLAELPDDAKIALASFDRRVHPLADGFMPRREAASGLARLSLEQRNGSHLDVALEHAGRLLASAPSGAAKRIVLFSDAHMRDALPNERVAEILPANTLVHSVSLSAGTPQLWPDDDTWSDAFAASGGMAWHAAVSGLAADAAALRASMRELVRPTRLRDVRVVDPISEEADWIDDVLDEGEGAHMAVIAKLSRRRLTVSGKLWRREVAVELGPSEAESTRWAALSLSEGIVDDEVSDADRKMLAWRGGTLSQHTAFVVSTSGSRAPADDHFDGATFASATPATFGRGGIGRIGRRHGPTHAPYSFLEARIAEARARCDDHTARGVYLETTLDEIVDARVADPSAHRCLLESLWRIVLPEIFRKYSHLRYEPR